MKPATSAVVYLWPATCRLPAGTEVRAEVPGIGTIRVVLSEDDMTTALDRAPSGQGREVLLNTINLPPS